MQKIKVRKRTIFIFLTLIGLLAYFNSFGVPFHYDDFSFLRENTIIKSFQLFSGWLTESYSRLITGRAFLLCTFLLNYGISGLDTFSYHIANFFIHVSTAFLVYLLIAGYVDIPFTKSLSCRLVRHPSENIREGFSPQRVAEDDPTSGNDNLAGFNNISFKGIVAALIFLLHPINTESVTYISSRSSELSAFFIIASMLMFFRSTQKKFSPFFYLLSLLFFVLGLSSKETAIVTPALILLFDIYFVSGSIKEFRPRIKYYLIFLLILPAGFVHYSGLVLHPAMYHRPWMTHILTELKVFTEYIRLLILPVGLNIDHDIKSSAFFDQQVLVSVFVLAGLSFIASFLKNRNKIISFSIFWIFLNLLPFLFVRLQDYMAERWVYSASIGAALLMSEMLMGLSGRYKKSGILAIFSIVFLFGILTYTRNDVYRNPIVLWSDAVKKAPEKIRPYTNLCAYYAENKELDKAIEICNIAVNKGSDQAETYINLATVYFYKNELDNSEKILLSMAGNRKIRLNNFAAEVYHYNLGSVYKGKKQYEKAIAEYKNILKTSPKSPSALGLIAECYILLGMKDMADEYSRMAADGIPQNGDDYIMLAKSFFRLGENQKGVESLNKAVIADPLNVNIRHAVAKIFLDGGNEEAAYRHFSVMAKLSPDFAASYTGMGKAMLAKGNLGEARKNFDKALSLIPPDSPDRNELIILLDKANN